MPLQHGTGQRYDNIHATSNVHNQDVFRSHIHLARDSADVLLLSPPPAHATCTVIMISTSLGTRPSEGLVPRLDHPARRTLWPDNSTPFLVATLQWVPLSILLWNFLPHFASRMTSPPYDYLNIVVDHLYSKSSPAPCRIGAHLVQCHVAKHSGPSVPVVRSRPWYTVLSMCWHLKYESESAVSQLPN